MISQVFVKLAPAAMTVPSGIVTSVTSPTRSQGVELVGVGAVVTVTSGKGWVGVGNVGRAVGRGAKVGIGVLEGEMVGTGELVGGTVAVGVLSPG